MNNTAVSFVKIIFDFILPKSEEPLNWWEEN